MVATKTLPLFWCRYKSMQVHEICFPILYFEFGAYCLHLFNQFSENTTVIVLTSKSIVAKHFMDRLQVMQNESAGVIRPPVELLPTSESSSRMCLSA